MAKKKRHLSDNKPYDRPERHARKKNRSRKHKQPQKEPLIRLSQVPLAFILLLYIFVVTFTPNWMALDTNTSKFMTLSLINLLSFAYLLTRQDIRGEPGLLMRFFDTKAGLAYGVFLGIVLLSFTQAINILESVLMFTKLFAVFTAVFIVSVILMRDIRLVKMIVVVGALLLIFDSVSVFYYIGQFIEGDIRRISDIKSVYSNKNILASAIFVKIPFAIYLWKYDSGPLKLVGLVGMFTGMLATLFMATRGFYVGLIVVTAVFLLYTIYNLIRDKKLRPAGIFAGYVVSLVLALLIFSVVRANLYPQRGRHTQSVGAQLATIQDDAQESNRVNAWFWSFDIIRENPLLGVGAGNWKINILEHENQVNTGYIYLYKAHNDFIEMMTETGIPGGLLYIFIFVFVFWNLIKAYLYKDRNTRRYRHLFLAGFGLMFYGFDAFFNFPHDRPEIQMLFALYLPIGIVAILSGDDAQDEKDARIFSHKKESSSSFRNKLAKFFSAGMILLMIFSAYVLHLNFQSSKLQRVIYQEIMSGQLRESSDRFIGHFPWIPNLSVWGESLTSLKARYLMEEEQYREVIDMLKDDRTNPFDGRREHFMATAYNHLAKKDSALIYSKKAYAVKPHYFRNVFLLTNLLSEKNRLDETGPYLDGFLAHSKSNVQAYLYATSLFHRSGDIERAWQHIDTAYQAMPNDSLIERQHQFLYHQKFIAPNQHLYRQAMRHYNDQEFEEALPYLLEYVSKIPFDHNVYRILAFVYYGKGDHEKTIETINEVFDRDLDDPVLMNLRGACYNALGDTEAACEDFYASMEAGNESGETNYRNFCGGEE